MCNVFSQYPTQKAPASLLPCQSFQHLPVCVDGGLQIVLQLLDALVLLLHLGHDDIETIKKNNPLYDLSFGQVRVVDRTVDPSGKILIFPMVKSQGLVTYYTPGDYPFGAAKYVPNYEDSVYLSNVGYRTRFGHND